MQRLDAVNVELVAELFVSDYRRPVMLASNVDA